MVILIYLSILTSLTAEEAPFFRLKDQRGVTIDSRSFKGKTLFLLGCNFKDVVLCRKHGRKIYWRMQNLLEEAEDTTVFVAFLDFRGAPKEVFSYIEKERNKNYESIYLDEKGVLSSGVRSGFSWLRIFSRNKRLLYESYYSEVDDRTVDSLYEIIRRQKK
nr:hypothetical protein [Leptospira gomenensis]